MVPLILMLVACGPEAEPPDPALVEAGRAVAAWERGAAALEAGRVAEARAAFGEAVALRPKDALLHAWAAEAALRAGDRAAARASLDQAVAHAPAFGEARLMRARLLLADDGPDAARDDLIAALQAKAITPRGVLRDAELRGLAGLPGYEFLPGAPLEAWLDVPPGVAFLGSEVEVALRVEGAVEGPIEVRGGEVPVPARVVRTVEADDTTPTGDHVRTLRWTLRITGAGTVQVGPLTVVQGEHALEVPAASFVAQAPGGARGPEAVPVFGTVWGVLGNHAVPDAWQEGDRVVIAAPSGARVATTPARPLERPDLLVRDGLTAAEIHVVPAPVERVRVTTPAGVVLDGPPRPASGGTPEARAR